MQKLCMIRGIQMTTIVRYFNLSGWQRSRGLVKHRGGRPGAEHRTSALLGAQGTATRPEATLTAL